MTMTANNCSPNHYYGQAKMIAETEQKGRTLIVNYFPRDMGDAELAAVFQGCIGPVSRIRIVRDPDSQKSKCYGLLECLHAEEAHKGGDEAERGER